MGYPNEEELIHSAHGATSPGRRKLYVYVASSWRNRARQQAVVQMLRAWGFEVYDFADSDGFHWSEIDPAYNDWSLEDFRDALSSNLAIRGFRRDIEALDRADIVLLVNPCGKSAHLELGYAAARASVLAWVLLVEESFEPELMYKMADEILIDYYDLYRACMGVNDNLNPATRKEFNESYVEEYGA